MGCGATRSAETNRRYIEAALKAGPPKPDRITFKSKTATYNHAFDFAIGPSGFLWVRRRAPVEAFSTKEELPTDQWEPLDFEGFFRKPSQSCVEISADEEYLVAVDASNVAFLRQVIKGRRPSYIAPGEYEMRSVLTSVTWDPRWFSMPVLEYVEALLRGGDLEVERDRLALSITERGAYTYFTEDHMNRKIPDKQNKSSDQVNYDVITMYVLEKGGWNLRLYDPWLPKYAKGILALPETKETCFCAVSMCASASTIMVIGYECHRAKMHKQLKILTLLADIDSLGWNPIFNYSFTERVDRIRDLFKAIRVLPFEVTWVEHSLPDLEAQLTSQISIEQTSHSWDTQAEAPGELPPYAGLPATPIDDMYKCGGGRRAREMKVMGSRGGEKGFFRKMIADSEWSFVPVPEVVLTPSLQREAEITNKLPRCNVADFVGTCTFSGSGDDRELNVRLIDFSQKSLVSELYFEDASGRRLPHRSLKLYLRETLQIFLPPWFHELENAVLPSSVTDAFSLAATLVCDDPDLSPEIEGHFAPFFGSLFEFDMLIKGQHSGVTLDLVGRNSDAGSRRRTGISFCVIHLTRDSQSPQ